MLSILFLITYSPAIFFSPLSLHDALPICVSALRQGHRVALSADHGAVRHRAGQRAPAHVRLAAARLPHARAEDRKSTRLNSSHVAISYAVFCLKKKRIRLITSKKKDRPIY